MITLTKKTVDELFNEQRLKKIAEAHRYYENHNDICDHKRMVVGPKGEMVESRFMSNNRLSHPFTRKITEQKVAYLLGKPFNIEGDDQAFVDAARDAYGKAFMRMLRAVCREAILCGEAWLMVYYDETGALRYRHVPTESIGAVWEDETEERLKYVIRRYRADDSDEHSYIYELWTADSVTTYRESNGEFRKLSRRSHFSAQAEDGETESAGIGRVPFVRFRYNTKGIGLLAFIKSLVDDYDKNASDLSNLIQDSPNTMRIVKGYGGDIEQMVKNMALFNLVQIAPDADITTLQNNIDVNAIETHMARLRKDILDSACAVDTQEASQGNLSGVAIKFRFSDLDLDCQQMGSEFAASMEELSWFLCEDMRARGQGDHDPTTLNFIWATELIANEQEVIQNLQNSAEILSLETRIAQHPYVNDPEAELERVKTEQSGVPGEGASSQFGA